MAKLADSIKNNFGRCVHCQRMALLGAVVLWVLTGLIAVFGDPRQLLAALGLGAGALTILWLAHRVVAAGRARKTGEQQYPPDDLT
jgi:hypothetical protein